MAHVTPVWVVHVIPVYLAQVTPVWVAHVSPVYPYDLVSDIDDYEKAQNQIDEQRVNVINTIIDIYDIETVLRFSESVPLKTEVGIALGSCKSESINSQFVSHVLSQRKDDHIDFIRGFIGKSHHERGWVWSEMILNTLSVDQKIEFLVHHPFNKLTWGKISELGPQSEEFYWKETIVRPNVAKDDIVYAIDMLLKYKRPNYAVECCSWAIMKNIDVSTQKYIDTLLLTATSEGSLNDFNMRNALRIIEYLQKAPLTNQNDLTNVEWAYLPLLDGYMGSKPVTLENKLASEPEFFHELIQIMYHSTKDLKQKKESSKEQQSVAQNVWQLLRQWDRIPGTAENGSFSKTKFTQWIETICALSKESGRYEVAMIHIGEVLIHAPADPSGLWIDKSVAEVLNDKSAEDMRDGFRSAFFNSRGAHWVDPSGDSERKLADKYRKMADEVENAGYFRLANKLKALSREYEEEAKRVM